MDQEGYVYFRYLAADHQGFGDGVVLTRCEHVGYTRPRLACNSVQTPGVSHSVRGTHFNMGYKVILDSFDVV
jgi:hypothetical protein